jgi:hypothetical protein
MLPLFSTIPVTVLAVVVTPLTERLAAPPSRNLPSNPRA